MVLMCRNAEKSSIGCIQCAKNPGLPFKIQDFACKI